MNHKNIDPSNPGLTHQVLVAVVVTTTFEGNLCFYMSHCFLALQAVSIKLGEPATRSRIVHLNLN